MNLKLEIEFSKADILHEVDALKKQIDDMRPLPDDIEGRVMQKLRLDWNYHSNAIEGNKLSYGETIAFLMEGITAKGKPLKDHLDIRGHNEAINFLLSIVKDTRPISEADIRNLHKMILVEPYDVKAQTTDGLPTTKRITLGEYKTLANHVKTTTGEIHYYSTPEETPAKMQELMEWYTEASANSEIHPVVIAALFHHKFVSIHPFDDGNGRLSRILMNLILMQKGHPPVVIKMDDRQNYYALLSRADSGDSWPFVEYIAETLKWSLQLYAKAAKGGDIDEDEDIDKEIALLKREMDNSIHLKEKRSKEKVKSVIKEDLLDLFRSVAKKTAIFESYFFSTSKWIRFHFPIENKLSFDLKVFHEGGDSNIIEYLNSSKYLITHVTFELEYKEFKNATNAFNVDNYLNIEFNEYDYSIFNHRNEKILEKLYHDPIGNKDQQIIIKNFVAIFKEFIEDNLNQ